MLRTILTLIALLTLLLPAAFALQAADLTQAVEAARLLLNKSDDGPACGALAAEILKHTELEPQSPLLAEAFALAARLEAAARHTDAALTLSRRVVTDYPDSKFAPQAFDLAWGVLTQNGAHPLAGAEMAKDFAGTQPSNAAARYYELAFEGYRSANQWQNALQASAQMLERCPLTPAQAPMLLAMGEVAMTTGDMAYAEQALEILTDRFANLPQAIPARVQLASIYQTSGDRTAAQEQWAAAWSTFQKKRESSGFQQGEIRTAAASALWELQAERKRELERLAQIGAREDEAVLKSEAADLLKTFDEVAKTDPGRAPQVFAAVGDVHNCLGDALLAIGFRRALGEGSSRREPYTDAMEEYGKAVAFYAQSVERARIDNENAEAQQIAQKSATRAFEVTAGQGDAVYAWALELARYGPTLYPGATGTTERSQYLTKTVTPLLEEGLAYKSQALALSNTLPVARDAEILRRSLDVPLRPIVSELYALCEAETRAATAQGAELAAQTSFGFGSVSAMAATERAEQQFARAAEAASALQDVLNRLYTTLDQAYLPAGAMAFWDSLTVGTYHGYATLCRDFHENVAVASTALASKTDDASLAARKRLNRLQNETASAEFAGLVRWHSFADAHDVIHPLADRLSARLAELDPQTYGNPDDLPSASRRKP